MKRREFLRNSLGAAALAASVSSHRAQAADSTSERPVRIGIVGVGNRGTHLLRILLGVPGVKVNALCDLDAENLQKARDLVAGKQGDPPAGYGDGPDAYGRMLQRDDLDAILVATPTKWHCPMAVAAMKAGKHVASEVPAGFHLDELWELVRTKEATGKRYILLENYLYAREAMAVYNMAMQGIFGDPYYAECAYIHDCRFMLFKDDGSLDWWGDWAGKYYGHDYPTHAMGPVSKWMGINDGDRVTHLSAMMSTPRVLERYATREYGPDSQQAKIEWANGDFTSVMMTTEHGRLIRNDYDVNSPRPMSNYYLLQGVRGCYDSRVGLFFDQSMKLWEDREEYYSKYEHPVWKQEGEQAKHAGHGGGDYFVVRAFVNMVREDREPWIDVYDAASWSVIYHCSKQSIDANGGSVEMPDFTGGKWRDKDWRQGRPVV